MIGRSATLATRPRVGLIATGGTIANTPSGRLSIEEVLDELPDIGDLADLVLIDVARRAGQDLSFADLLETVHQIDELFARRPEIDGIVVTAGSNASADLAWFLHLTVRHRRPVVVTAAQRKRRTLSEDASRNLLDAVRVAASCPFGNHGVVLVVNEMIHGARDVAKELFARPDGWRSGELGPLGLVSGGEVHFYRQPIRRHTLGSEFDMSGVSALDLPPVEILASYLEADPRLISVVIEQLGVAGLVIGAFPTGSPTTAQARELHRAAEQGCIVVIANRGRLGRLSPRDPAFVTADTLSVEKAQILTRIAMYTGAKEPGDLQRIFDEY